MQFQMNGEGRRSELRQMFGGTEASWSVTKKHDIISNIAIPTPPAELGEFTFLQVHCTDKPALRVSWKRNQDGTPDAIVATLRTGLGDNDFKKEVIARRTSNRQRYIIKVASKKVRIILDGKRVYEESLNFWAGFNCYFKAGVYIQDSSNSKTKVRVKFDQLRWK